MLYEMPLGCFTPDEWPLTPVYAASGPTSEFSTIILTSHFGIKDGRLTTHARVLQN